MKLLGRTVILAVLLAAAMGSGCSGSQLPRSSTGASSTQETSSTTAVGTTVTPDPVAFARSQRASVQSTTAPTRLDAAAALKAASATWSAPSSDLVVVTRKVSYSKGELVDRVVWLVGVSPPTNSHGVIAASGVATPTQSLFVIDAQSGRVIGAYYGSLKSAR